MNLHTALTSFLFLMLIPFEGRCDVLGFPIVLDDKNTTITFEVDSTWHLVHGNTSGVNGRLSLANPNDPSSVQGTISLPVDRFDTDSSRRDARMREVMGSNQFPDVKFSISSAEMNCDWSRWREENICPIRIHGMLSIRDQSRAWLLSGKLSLTHGEYSLDATGKLSWPDFGVTDPSILVARLNPEVAISIRSTWQEK